MAVPAPVTAGRGRASRGTVAAMLSCAVLLSAACTVSDPAAPVHRSLPQAPATGRAVTGSAQRALASRYLVIAKAGNRRLDVNFTRLAHRDRNRLAAAEADLRDVAATEQLFDRRLLEIAFAPGIEQVVRLLYRVNQARARLTSAAAAATSLGQLHAYDRRLTAANRPVEQAVRTIRRQLGLPPPSAS